MWKIQFKPLARKTPLMAKNPKTATAPKHAMVLAAGLGTRPLNGRMRVPKPAASTMACLGAVAGLGFLAIKGVLRARGLNCIFRVAL